MAAVPSDDIPHLQSTTTTTTTPHGGDETEGISDVASPLPPAQLKSIDNSSLATITTEQTTTGAATTATPSHRRVIRRQRRRPKEDFPSVDPLLLSTILEASNLPKAYNFEISKTVERIHQLNAKHVALQMPEGMLLYATVLSDILKRLANSVVQQITIMGDVTYGACCIDDLGAQAMGVELLVHYGHSCLVPLAHTVIPCLYVFVEIQIDVPHLVDCLDLTLQQEYKHVSALTSIRDRHNDDDDDETSTNVGSTNVAPHIFLLGTVQFRGALTEASLTLKDRGYSVTIPQAKPLSPGEVLGCTSPKLTVSALPKKPNVDCNTASSESSNNNNDNLNAVVCFVADGRFHLEATMISNPHITTFYRYDPYGKQLTIETYDHHAMLSIRQAAIDQARTAKTFGVILGTLGRQGNPALVQNIRSILAKHERKSFLVLLSEITPAKLLLMPTAEVWVQVACPRLSIDWGHYFDNNRPLLTPYELLVCLGETDWQDIYPMDYYTQDGGLWGNYHPANKNRMTSE